MVLLKEKYPQYNIGDYSYGDIDIQNVTRGAILSIGKFCSFTEGTLILLGVEHEHRWGSTYPFNLIPDASEWPRAISTRGPIVIGSDVWVGARAVILSGVIIGSGAVIGAGAVVRKNVEPYEIVIGNPAQHYSYRCNEVLRNRFLKIAWWDWPIGQICMMRSVLQSPITEEGMRRLETCRWE
jgi:acetyltransferase-like isoleucine patch superfamily enzyme